MDKACTKCNITKDLEDFVKSKITKSGYRGCCKTCFNQYYATRRIEKYEMVRSYERKFHRARRLRYEYNMTEEQLAALHLSQEGRCAICQTVPDRLVIDHCHSSGKVRGLLCNSCNLALGMVKDSMDTLSSMFSYIERNQV